MSLRMNPLYRLQFEKAQNGHVLLFPEGMVKLSESAAEILLHVDGKNTDEDIKTAIRQKFPDAPDDMEQDIDCFIEHAKEKKWVLNE
ncbi:MAG: pyrroloquinoline quinone biosynthesis peptide chaperone PqqD [Pseudomonadota bacterium]